MRWFRSPLSWLVFLGRGTVAAPPPCESLQIQSHAWLCMHSTEESRWNSLLLLIIKRLSVCTARDNCGTVDVNTWQYRPDGIQNCKDPRSPITESGVHEWTIAQCLFPTTFVANTLVRGEMVDPSTTHKKKSCSNHACPPSRCLRRCRVRRHASIQGRASSIMQGSQVLDTLHWGRFNVPGSPDRLQQTRH